MMILPSMLLQTQGNTLCLAKKNGRAGTLTFQNFTALKEKILQNLSKGFHYLFE